MPKNKYICHNCKSSFERYASTVRHPERCFCSHKCSSTWNGFNNNPNFGNKWSEKQRQDASVFQIEKYNKNPELREIVGRSNRGVKFSPERILAMHENRSKESYIHDFSDTTKKLIGKKSRERWKDAAYQQNMRQKMVENGCWVSNEDRIPYDIYYQKCQWIERMVDRFPQERVSVGLWHYEKNKGGLVRDHMFSRNSGWKERVFPEIMRHPCNCDMIPHGENVRKRFIQPDSISLDTLLQLIENFKGSWQEQKVVLDLVKSYREGKRYEW